MRKWSSSVFENLKKLLPSAFTLMIVLGGLLSGLVVISNQWVSSAIFIFGLMLILFSWLMATAVGSLFFQKFAKGFGLSIAFVEVLGTYYRTYLSNLGFPGVLGSGLKLKRLSSRTRPDVATSFLLLERIYSIIFQSTLLIGLMLFISIRGQLAFNSELTLPLIGTIIVSTILLVFSPSILKLTVFSIRWLSTRFQLGVPDISLDYKLSKKMHMLVASNVMLPMAIRLSIAGFVGEIFIPGSLLWVLIARSVASLVSMVPLPLITIVAREGAFVGTLLLAGYNSSLVLGLTGCFILAGVGNGILGLAFEIPVSVRGVKKRFKDSA
ncbi:MAG: hypothetical protein RIS51_489 [Actinomycetota bacterium]